MCSSSEGNVPLPSKKINRGLIGVIHVSTTTVLFRIYITPAFTELLTESEEIQLLMPRDGWFEQDAMEIMTVIYQCCSNACAALPDRGYHPEDVSCIGITNQRETTVMWNAVTGQPLYPAIVWNDIRTTGIVDHLNSKLDPKKIKLLHSLSGLWLSPFFSALKIKWMQENVPAVHAAVRNGECKAGTLDAWIIWNLTRGKTHVTDVTNASRTLLMNIQTLNWEPLLLKIFNIDVGILPKIRSSSEMYDRTQSPQMAFKEVHICGIIGNQQAALVGQSCLERGQTNCTYDMGCFVLCNTGSQRVFSRSGLLTTVAYKMGPNASPVYALEGNVAVGGRVFEWLTMKLRILPDVQKAEQYALAVKSTAGVYFVPAFTGLYAPHWVNSARGTITGLTAMHNAKHVVRAAHEAICYQVYDILECIRQDCGMRVHKLTANGGLCKNLTLMQLQADISGIPMAISVRNDRATLGAAYCAAHAYNFDLSAIIVGKTWFSAPQYKDFKPAIDDADRQLGYTKWQRSVKRSFHWADVKSSKETYKYWSLLIAFLVLLAAVAIFYYFEMKQVHKKWGQPLVLVRSFPQ